MRDMRQSLSEARLRDVMAWRALVQGDIRMAMIAVEETADIEALLPLLSKPEQEAAASLDDVAERRHLVVRRAFQRVFVAILLDWTDLPRHLPMVHARDKRTVCAAAPRMMLSFSSSRNVYCACASATHEVGIDVEQARSMDDPLALARRFFTDAEARIVETAEPQSRAELFLRMWTAKEAGLKALGLGIVSGLNRFTLNGDNGIVALQDGSGWTLTYFPHLTDSIVAVVHRPLR